MSHVDEKGENKDTEEEKENSVCDDCARIFDDAAALLWCSRIHGSVDPPGCNSDSESDSELVSSIPFDEAYQSRMRASITRSRCHMCVLLLQSCRGMLLAPLTARLQLRIHRYATQGNVYATQLCVTDDSGNEVFSDLLCIEHGEQRDVRTLVAGKTWCFETLETIRTWVGDCSSTHTICDSARTSARLPLRLIDVLAGVPEEFLPRSDRSDDETFNRLTVENLPGVCIVSTNSAASGIPYVTLSYRWPDSPSLLLDSRASFCAGQDISHLLVQGKDTAVFRHAIHVTRSLGYRYLWIDALCIMQDDETEKADEIMHMDEIYHNCALNIAATEGTLDGLVFDRNVVSANPCRRTVLHPQAQRETLLRAYLVDCSILPSSQGRLNQRGWVFQERMLAPRILHFARDQVCWECSSLDASEVLPRGHALTRTSPDRAFLRGFLRLGGRQQWSRFVSQYSATSVTYASDRLLAVSAVARIYGSAMGFSPSEYLAGMWRAHLPASLIWYQEGGASISGHGEELLALAPSWSWASLPTEVSCYSGDDSNTVTTLLAVDMKQTSPPELFDGTTYCRLRVRGPMCKVRRHVSQDKPPQLYIGEDGIFAGPVSTGVRKSTDLWWDTHRKILVDCLDKDDPTSSTFFLLQITSESGPDNNDTHVRGIILRRADFRGTFVRVGAFYIEFRREERFWETKLGLALTGRIETLEQDDYIQVKSGGLYTVDLI